MRPPTIAYLTCFLAALLSGSRSAATTTEPLKPNIILILTDDLGWGDVGVFHQNNRGNLGLPAIRTPHLDALAKGGVYLTNHYASAPVCAPSRASLLTGVTQGHASVRDNQFDKALEDNHTLATVLRGGGYTTAAIGKWGLQGEREGAAPNWPAHPLRRGFDYFYGYIRHRDGHEHYPKEGTPAYAPYRPSPPDARAAEEEGPGPGKQVWENYTEVSAQLDRCYTTDLFTARAKQWIINHATKSSEKPFFLYLAFDTPHATLELPTRAYPEGGGLRGGLQWIGRSHQMINTAEGTVDSWTDPAYRTAVLRGSDGTERPWPDVYRRYATSVSRIDEAVGDLIQLLRDLKIDDRTLVVFTSDNGPSIESYLPERNSPQFFASFGPFDGIKRDCWEGGMRVPAIVAWPQHIPETGARDFPSAQWDWLPTFADVAGMPTPARADGVSLMPLLLNGSGSPRPRLLYFEYMMRGEKTPDFPEFEAARRGRVRNQMQAVRLGDFIGVRYDVRSAADDFEIYDVVRDPKEKNNLGSGPGHAELQRRLKALALQCRRPDPSAPRPYDGDPVPAEDVGPLLPGVEWCCYERNFPWVPNFSGLTPTARGTAKQPDLVVRSRNHDVGLLFTGYIEVPADGEYTFFLSTDAGALLRIHEATVIDADFNHRRGRIASGKMRLKAGSHPFRLSYARRDSGPPFLSLEWAGPSFDRRPIPACVFQRADR